MYTIRKKIDINFYSKLMEYDRGDSFPFNFDPNGIQYWLKIKGITVTTIIFHSI